MSASLDHVMPLIAGGQHTRHNTQIAHWICNVRKGARATGNPELVAWAEATGLP